MFVQCTRKRRKVNPVREKSLKATEVAPKAERSLTGSSPARPLKYNCLLYTYRLFNAVPLEIAGGHLSRETAIFMTYPRLIHFLTHSSSRSNKKDML